MEQLSRIHRAVMRIHRAVKHIHHHHHHWHHQPPPMTLPPPPLTSPLTPPPQPPTPPPSPPILRGGLPIYRLTDFHDEEIKGTFYQSELQKVDVRDDDIWKIEKILKTKGTGNNKHYFIKWLHWPKKFNSWIFARDVNNLWFYYQWEWTIPERLTSSLGNLRPCTKDSILLALSWGWRYCRVVDDSRISNI